MLLPNTGEAEALSATLTADVEETAEPPGDDGEKTTPAESKSPSEAAGGDDAKTTEPPAQPVESESPPGSPDKTGKVENCTCFRFPY